MDTQRRIPYLLLILDGFGYREETKYNAIREADTPTWDALWQERPHTLINASAQFVGLPEGQMGNSEVGHMTIGCGRTIYQDFTRISLAIEDHSIEENPVLKQAVEQSLADGRCLHLLGLLSPGGVHSHEDHIIGMVRMAVKQGCQNLAVHAFLDGRDTPPRSAKASLLKLQAVLDELGVGHVASVSGRYYAMDRDKRWERLEPVYQLLTTGKADYVAANAVEALEQAYARDENDEFVLPTHIEKGQAIQSDDPIVFMNFRSDRARQLSRKLLDNGYQLSTLTEYSKDISAPYAFAPQTFENCLGDYLSQLNKTQLRIAETEKYAHVTFFFNGGIEQPFSNEERILVQSPKVATYDLQPEMSAPELTEKLVAAIRSQAFDVIVCNYANADMVGHTGIYDAALAAMVALDKSLKQVLEALDEVQGHCLLTADHGNIEKMYDVEKKQVHTAHTCDPVPLVYVGTHPSFQFVSEMGTLADVAPTLLDLMKLSQPTEMTGKSLIQTC